MSGVRGVAPYVSGVLYSRHCSACGQNFPVKDKLIHLLMGFFLLEVTGENQEGEGQINILIYGFFIGGYWGKPRSVNWITVDCYGWSKGILPTGHSINSVNKKIRTFFLSEVSLIK